MLSYSFFYKINAYGLNDDHSLTTPNGSPFNARFISMFQYTAEHKKSHESTRIITFKNWA